MAGREVRWKRLKFEGRPCRTVLPTPTSPVGCAYGVPGCVRSARRKHDFHKLSLAGGRRVAQNSVKQMMNKLDSLQQMLYFASHTAPVSGDGCAWAFASTIIFSGWQQMSVREGTYGAGTPPTSESMCNSIFQKT